MQRLAPGKVVGRWVVGKGGFIGEATLQGLLEADYYVRRNEAEPSYCELTNVYVHPLRRGQGWATAVIESALHYAERRKWPVFLRAVPYGIAPADLDMLIKFYRHYGFRQVRRGDERELVLRW